MGAGKLPRMDLTALPNEVRGLVRAQLEAGGSLRSGNSLKQPGAW